MPYFFGLVILAVQVMTVVHVVRTGRDRSWVYIVIFVPLAGCVAYFFAEMLPDLMGYRSVRSAASSIESGIKNVVDPGRTYRKLYEEARLVDSAESKRVLAEECARKGNFAEAIEHFRAALVGIHAEDPAILLGLGEAMLESDKFKEALVEFKRVESIDKHYKPLERKLMTARSLEGLGEAKAAETEYRSVIDIVPGPEGKVRFAHFLYTQGRITEARDLLQQILDQSKRLPKHSRRLNRYWLDQAETAMQQLRAS